MVEPIEKSSFTKLAAVLSLYEGAIDEHAHYLHEKFTRSRLAAQLTAKDLLSAAKVERSVASVLGRGSRFLREWDEIAIENNTSPALFQSLQFIRKVTGFTSEECNDESDASAIDLVLSDSEEHSASNTEDLSVPCVIVDDSSSCDSSDERAFQPVAQNANEIEQKISLQIAGIWEYMKPHQRNGVLFILRTLVGGSECEHEQFVSETSDRIRNSVNRSTSACQGSTKFHSGCVLGDFMGLGKTLQSVAVCIYLLRIVPALRILIIAPSAVLMHWEAEFRMAHSLLKAPLTPANRFVFPVNSSRERRNELISSWYSRGGVMLITYDLFRLSSIQFKQELLSPGPEMLVLDEGHRIRTEQSQISNIIDCVSSPLRLALTGYPLQNNLKEYWTLLSIVAPSSVPHKRIFNEVYTKQFTLGNLKRQDQLPYCRRRAYMLNQSLKKFVLRRGPSLLKPYLPPREEFVIFVASTPKQNHVLSHMLEARKSRMTWDSFFKLFHSTLRVNFSPALESGSPHIPSCSKAQLEQLLTSVDFDSAKLRITLEIIEESIARDEKVVIFSQVLSVLQMIEDVLRNVPGVIVDRIDGAVTGNDRFEKVQLFNSNVPTATNVMVMSTKAGGEGISLVGGSRLLILDASWNPSHDVEASCRVYRFGQNNPVYVYRLVSDRTLEARCFQRQVLKDMVSTWVVDDTNVDRGGNGNIGPVSTSSSAGVVQNEFPDIEDVEDELTAGVIHHNRSYITKVQKWDCFNDDGMLLDRVSDDAQNLLPEERKKAHEEFNASWREAVAFQTCGSRRGSQGGASVGGSTTHSPSVSVGSLRSTIENSACTSEPLSSGDDSRVESVNRSIQHNMQDLEEELRSPSNDPIFSGDNDVVETEELPDSIDDATPEAEVLSEYTDGRSFADDDSLPSRSRKSAIKQALLTRAKQLSLERKHKQGLPSSRAKSWKPTRPNTHGCSSSAVRGYSRGPKSVRREMPVHSRRGSGLEHRTLPVNPTRSSGRFTGHNRKGNLQNKSLGKRHSDIYARPSGRTNKPQNRSPRKGSDREDGQKRHDEHRREGRNDYEYQGSRSKWRRTH